ncbi:hypothetical protein SDC9_165578 [bioreactor metagenome]|uniref:Uncharacterized protein n=1 Tax=bioreactor metagenome TaxID=1076179 RepID=A0A645FX75_9ZZZZ
MIQQHDLFVRVSLIRDFVVQNDSAAVVFGRNCALTQQILREQPRLPHFAIQAEFERAVLLSDKRTALFRGQKALPAVRGFARGLRANVLEPAGKEHSPGNEVLWIGAVGQPTRFRDVAEVHAAKAQVCQIHAERGGNRKAELAVFHQVRRLLVCRIALITHLSNTRELLKMTNFLVPFVLIHIVSFSSSGRFCILLTA